MRYKYRSTMHTSIIPFRHKPRRLRSSVQALPRLFAVALAFSLAPTNALAERATREAEVIESNGLFEARVNGRTAYSGLDMVAAIQAAVDGLTPERDWKETVHIRASGTIKAEGNELITIGTPSFTILDFHENTMRVQGPATNTIIPVRAQNARQIEVRNLRVTGNPRFGIFMKACEDVLLANIHLSLGPTGDSTYRGGVGIRTEGGDEPWSGDFNRNFVLENIFVEGTGGHGVVLWRTDGLTIGTITTRNTGGCGLLLNQSRNARIALVDAYRANHGGGYAGFRAANDAGPNIVVDKVISVASGRGVFTVSGSNGITIHEVEISRSTGHGMLIEDTQNFVVNGGTITDSGAEGVRITSRRLGQGPGADHKPASNVTVQNLRVSGHGWAIRETLPRTNNNRILNNDLRGNRNCLAYYGEGTVAEGNTCDCSTENCRSRAGVRP